ncbi:transcriptional regulator [Thermoanaerobacter kivui]|uniref:Transcriptional regulator n=1 Tax=Thermoanaerobacter kivui TaxID=2325 RepID=A0A097AN97_THEKI|nr:LysR substrate-binding domain-containing protein [Thermoanaerobacter kivui]AIS51290.1 transcriptional regulator [Thermoanaerobacter kivui]
MNIDNLKAFYKTVYYKSIYSAAKELYLSQPAISQQIKALEKDLKATLLKRSNRGVVPTLAGELVYQYAERILNLYDNMIKDLECYENDCVNRLTISCCPTIGQYALPCAIHEFKKRQKNLVVHIEHNFTPEVIYNVKEAGIDIGFIEGCYSDENIDCISLGEYKMHFVANGSWENKKLSKNKLFHYNFFVIHKKCSLRKIIEETLLSHGVDIKKLKIEMESPSIESIKSSVAAGHGLSILPYIAIKKELYTKTLSIVNVDDIDFTYNYSIIYNKKIYKKSKKDFIDFIKINGQNLFC